MRTDVAMPFESFTNNKNRDEIFIVYFDGFIKNISEGIVKILLSIYQEVKESYSNLDFFKEFDSDDLYDNTVMFKPADLIQILSENTLNNENEIEQELQSIRTLIDYDKLKITTFEYCLYNLLQEDFIKKCFFYKDSEFTDNELQYLNKQFGEFDNKIAYASGSIIDLFEDENPTTIFTSDETIIDIFSERYADNMLQDKLFVILNNSHFINYDEESKIFQCDKEYLEKINLINENKVFGIVTSYNFQLNVDI